MLELLSLRFTLHVFDPWPSLLGVRTATTVKPTRVNVPRRFRTLHVIVSISCALSCCFALRKRLDGSARGDDGSVGAFRRTDALAKGSIAIYACTASRITDKYAGSRGSWVQNLVRT